MLRSVDGKRLKANGFKSVNSVKAQFRKAGHVPGTVAELKVARDNVSFWLCECGAELRFRKEGKFFNRVEVWERLLGN
jgi:hypothetical protein